MNLHYYISTLLLACTVGVNAEPKWAGMENLPDGPYSGVNMVNGSTTMTHMVTGEQYTFHIMDDGKPSMRRLKRSDYAVSQRSNALGKRGTDCWGYQLDVGGVDRGVQALKNWANNGVFLHSCRRNNYYGFNDNGVYVYYCINSQFFEGNLNVGDINEALSNMDGTCRRYEAGYFRWNSPELVGKCRSGTPVCLG